MQKHFPVIIAHSLPGQPGVKRLEKIIMQQGSDPGICARRAYQAYKRENLKGKKNITYYFTVKPEDVQKF
ncbi:hypothetical protein KW797_00025 [Candidatus Parcubacteria bacterium]|nr:hypothetical protein [Candidatus Parcubacteria bacterium]